MTEWELLRQKIVTLTGSKYGSLSALARDTGIPQPTLWKALTVHHRQHMEPRYSVGKKLEKYYNENKHKILGAGLFE